jgi:nitrate/nitrite-specific signal transduction histidine kinase
VIAVEWSTKFVGSNISNKRSKKMDNVTLIRLVAGALAVVVLFVIIWRRKRKIVE